MDELQMEVWLPEIFTDSSSQGHSEMDTARGHMKGLILGKTGEERSSPLQGELPAAGREGVASAH